MPQTATSDCAITLPAEWAPQSGVMLTWPHLNTDWRACLDQVEAVFVTLAKQIAQRQLLIISANNKRHRQHILAQLTKSAVNLKNITLYLVDSNDSWARDHGPITILDAGKPTLLDFTFNAWGGKFTAKLDNQITTHLHAAGAFGHTPLKRVEMVLEGGAIESDGCGTLLTSSHCLLSPTRNPNMDKASIEQQLCQLFGLSRVLWLDDGYLAGDDTDSHIDTLARFCDDKTIIHVSCDDINDEHYPALRRMQQQLQAMRTVKGEPYRLIPLPWPQIKRNKKGDKLPASYANFLVINGAVLAPTYDDPQDRCALERLQLGFPDRQIIGIPSLPLIQQFGSLHCVTMQLPEGVLP
ncbi:MAG: agmatine deiminase family protein [Gammaproteobacteria bacterium]|nr:agmatine deiminase family protein [Gammaproteobacteria bacterium]MCF6229237.1 agmatine deiminase family protein [Gammaproteobacteria bacterium]